MPFIGLITDWQQSDYYLGVLKGCIYSKLNDAKIIDINHTVHPHNIFQAAFVLKSCYTSFPEETVFIIGVSSYGSGPNGHICFKYLNRYILTSDNGFFSLFTDDNYDSAVQLKGIPTTFPEKDIFADYTCRIIQQEPMTNFGPEITEYYKNMNYYPLLDKNVITGMVMYVDNYGNAITNISRTQFEKIGKNRNFIIYPGNNNFKIKNISDGYDNEEEGELIALFNSLDYLEIANIKISASQFIKLEVKTNIRIQFI